MRKINLIFIVLSFSNNASSQNVGIGTSAPSQKLEVNGAIKIGTSTDNSPGSIRYNNGNFEGNNGSNWTSISLPPGSIVLSETQVNTPLTNAGFSLIGKTNNSFAGYGAEGAWTPIPLVDITDVTNIANTGSAYSGKKFMIWGGYYNGSTSPTSGFRNWGYIFDSTSNSWTTSNTTGAPAPRQSHFMATMPGNRFLIFGGNANPPSGGALRYNDGAIYNPATNTWSNLFSTTGAPSTVSMANPRYALDTVTNRLYVYIYYLSTPYLFYYNISSNTWTSLSTVNSPNTTAMGNSVWMGNPVNKWMFWGGNDPTPSANGAIYNPATNSWETMSAPPAFVTAVAAPAMHWTGTEVIIYGGRIPGLDNFSNQALKYNPVTNTWTQLASLNLPSPRFGHSTVYGDGKLFLWGGFEKQLDNSYVKVNSGAYYNLSQNSWHEIPATSGSPDPRANSRIAWTGTEMLIWGGSSESGREGALSGARYSPTVAGGVGFGGYQSKTYYLFMKM
ncbi:MAG TPA: kelch repeat-containing protein [Ferruginibacter sp.]|nr:kelch repeat-containing protein [Ferruginibacter sp.]